MHTLTDFAQKVCKKKRGHNLHKQTNVGFLSRQKMSQSFPLDIFGRVWGQKLTGRPWAHRTEVEIRTEVHLFFLKISLMSPFLLTTPRHPSHHLFTYFHLSFHLGRIQHHTRGQWLPLCVIFSTTRDGRVYLSVSTSPSHKMAVFASFGHTEHHTRW